MKKRILIGLMFSLILLSGCIETVYTNKYDCDRFERGNIEYYMDCKLVESNRTGETTAELCTCIEKQLLRGLNDV